MAFDLSLFGPKGTTPPVNEPQPIVNPKSLFPPGPVQVSGPAPAPTNLTKKTGGAKGTISGKNITPAKGPTTSPVPGTGGGIAPKGTSPTGGGGAKGPTGPTWGEKVNRAGGSWDPTYDQPYNYTPGLRPGEEQTKESAYYVDPQTMVDTQLTQILSQDSAYMQQAEARGRAAAQAKGLMGSTAGIQAVEAARIAAALPIAQQNAATWKTFMENDQTHDMARDIQTLGHKFNKQLQDMKISSEERQSYLGAMMGLSNSLMQSINSIMNNPDIKDKAKAYDNMWKTFKPQIKLMGDLVGYNVNFKKYGV